MTFQLVATTGHQDLIDLPWHLPLAAWGPDITINVAHGLSRHVVRFVSCGGVLYALKEVPEHIAEREYRLLRQLTEQSIPVVEAVGVVKDRPAGLPPNGKSRRGARAAKSALDAVLITRYLDFSLPYRVLFAHRVLSGLQDSLLDALAELLVRLHYVGFFWGDCSLSNTLFRRDAGALAAYLVDAETSEMHPSLSDNMRAFDLDIAEENVAGDLLDLQAAGGLPPEIDPFAIVKQLRRRYDDLWHELTREEVFGPDERYRIDARIRRLNELGFDVKEVELIRGVDGDRLRLQTHVVEPGHHRRRLMALTGLNVQENQARRLLNDIASYRAYLERTNGRTLPESLVAYRWLSEVFEPTIAAIPPDLRNKLEPAELFHQILDHRWYLSEQAGHDVGLGEAVASYIRNVLPFVPDERNVLLSDVAPMDEPTEPAGDAT